jgi:hypothetical protein
MAFVIQRDSHLPEQPWYYDLGGDRWVTDVDNCTWFLFQYSAERVKRERSLGWTANIKQVELKW